MTPPRSVIGAKGRGALGLQADLRPGERERRRGSIRASAPRKESGDSIRKSYEAQLAYYTGDTATYAAGFSSEADAANRMTAALCRNDLDAAEKALGELPVQHSSSWLMLYLAAQIADDHRAESYWRKALASFAHEPYGHTRLAAHFDGTKPLSTDQLLDFQMDVAEKRIFLTALGLHEPALRTACFARVGPCNASLRFPHHLVAAALSLPAI